jgi:thioredoxin reductase (NADPH)
MPQHVYDVAVVGAGPIGLELAVALKRAKADYVHFDARQIGYTISWYPPQTRFFSSNERIAIAGVPLLTPDQGKATREQYLTYLRGVVEQFDLAVRTYEPVTGIDRTGDGFTLHTRSRAGPQETRARRLVLATGGTDRARRLGAAGEELPHVTHDLGDPHTYFRRRVLVVGGRNSAIESALRCHHAGASVSISYRGASIAENGIKYWLVPEFQSLVDSGRIAAYFETIVTRITPTHVTLADKAGATREVPADFVLAQIGYEQDVSLFKKAGLELHGPRGAPVFDEETMQTPVPGLYVAGTAVGGTQEKYSVFIENCHVHVQRIMRSILGVEVDAGCLKIDLPES